MSQTLIPTYPAALFYEMAFNAPPSQAIPPAYWTDITARAVFQWGTTRGRQYELDTVPAGQWNPTLDNRDGALDPSNTASPYSPNVVPYRGCRIRALPGVNMLTVDQATAGEGSALTGSVTGLPQLCVVNDFGYPVTVITSGSAWQGTQVYQAVLPSGAAQYSTILMVQQIHVQPGQYYSFTAQAQVTSGNSPQANIALLFYDNSGNQVAADGGPSVTLTTGAGTWTQLTASFQAPTGAYSAWAKIEISGAASLTAQTTFLIDGLQLERSMTPTPWQMPQTVSQNLLPRAIATGTQSINPANDSAATWFSPNAGTVAQANWLPAPTSGQTTAVAWTTPASTLSTSPLYAGVANPAGLVGGAVQDIAQVTAGTTYTVSMYLSRTASADTTLQVTAALRWFDINGNVLSNPTGTAVTVPTGGAWVRGSCTATAPAGAVWGRPLINISSPSSTTAQNTIYSTGWQLEAASAPSAWVDPGATRYIYTGSIERWPQTWTMGGTWGQVQAVGVDAEALLAQDTLLAPFVEEVLALNPNFFYQLNDPAGSSSCADCSATRPPAPVENSPFGPGSLVFGSSITSSTTPGTFTGTPGPVATFNNNPSGAAPYQYTETFINIGKTTVAPGPPTSTTWTRILSWRSATVPTGTNDYNLWTSFPATFQAAANASYFFMTVNAGGFASMGTRGAASSGFIYTGTTNLCDGNWHQFAMVQNPSAGTNAFYVDGVLVASPTGNQCPTGCFTDALGCSINYGSNQYSQGHVGDLAHAIEIPAALTQAQITNLYNSFRNASTGDGSGARVQRVLNWLGYIGTTAIDTGSTANMGPATDLTGATGLDALNAITLTENGNLYVSSAGVLTFKSRAARYNQATPDLIFGEAWQWGEWPYEAITADYDPTHLFNDIQVTQYSTSQVAESIDATSENLYYQRILQRTTNQGLYTETVDCANYLLQQYKTARMRISSLTLHPAAMPGLFAVCLQLELGTRIRVMRRPPLAPPVQIDCFVESINWSIDPEGGGDATVQLQCSPADLSRYWSLAAAHTTLSTAVTAGASQATINALPDAALNALNSSLPQNYQLTFDPGTAIAETLTIAPPLPATNVGYTSATLTFTSAFQNNHSAGAVVCEPLPTGYTSPTTWDMGSVLGAAYASFAVAASSGTSTITVGKLQDARVNALGSDWNTGDLLSLSPGTPRWEGYNLLSPNQSTAGEGVLPLTAGTSGNTVGVMSAVASFSVTASATAWQGSNVWQSSVGGSATSGFRLLRILLPATPGQVYSASFYVRSTTSGANPQVAAQLVFLGPTGATVATTTSTSSTLTGSATAAWTRVTVSATAPAGAMWLQAGVPLGATGPGTSWTFQADGLQVEPNAAPSAYQTCPQVSSVATVVPGYATCVITLANPLASNHPLGDIVSDPLPAGTTSPTQVAATTRLAY